MTSDEIGAIESLLDSLLKGKQLATGDVPEGFEGICTRAERLSSLLEELKTYALQLSQGDVDATPPPRSNYLAAGLKQLQSQMLHLTWQAQRVAKGDYGQRIDFMGDFSDAFNEMVEQLRSREESLRDQQAAMTTIFNIIEPILVISADEPREVLYANEMAIARFNVQVGDTQPFTTAVSDLVKVATGMMSHEVHDIESDCWYAVTSHPLRWNAQRQALLLYGQDITLHKTRETKLDLAANTDALTGIGNRRAYDRFYADAWRLCQDAGRPISLIVFDLDFFKEFNDRYGHQAGDKMLAEFALILKRSISRGDDIVARYGGEEFIAALPFTQRESAMRLARSVCETTARRVLAVEDDNNVLQNAQITVSAGVSTVVPTPFITPDQLVRAADYALYEAKQAGRNRTQYHPVAPTPVENS